MGFAVITPAPLLQQQRRKRSREHKQDRAIHPLLAPRKRVRFGERPDHVNTPQDASNACHSDLNKQELWWTKQERASMTESYRATVKSFRKEHKNQVQHYKDIFEHCTQTPSESSNEYFETATIDVPLQVRGLETGIIPSIKAHRREHVQTVLDIQDQLWRLNSEMRGRVLGARSMKSSRPCRVMARLLGEGDAVVGASLLPSRRRRQQGQQVSILANSQNVKNDAGCTS
jgi:hypothetical protein